MTNIDYTKFFCFWHRLQGITSNGRIEIHSKQQCYTQQAKQRTKTRNKINGDGSQRSKLEPKEMVRTARQTGCHEKKRDGRPQTLMLQLPTASWTPTEHSPPQESQAQTYKPARDQHTLAARGRDTIRRCRRSVWDLEIAASKPHNRDRYTRWTGSSYRASGPDRTPTSRAASPSERAAWAPNWRPVSNQPNYIASTKAKESWATTLRREGQLRWTPHHRKIEALRRANPQDTSNRSLS